jgi:hypothetical protein
MAGRQVVDWDKDDIDTLGYMEVSVLRLGIHVVARKLEDLSGLLHNVGQREGAIQRRPGGTVTWHMRLRQALPAAGSRLLSRPGTPLSPTDGLDLASTCRSRISGEAVECHASYPKVRFAPFSVICWVRPFS